jgi:hypothetical protein
MEFVLNSTQKPKSRKESENGKTGKRENERVKIVEVDSSFRRKQFLELPFKLYKNDPHWIPPLNKDIEAVFDPQKNPAAKNGKYRRWLLENSTGIIGRVAAFINPLHLGTMEQPIGGMGFFECVNDSSAASMLFDSCKKWLEEQGMKGIDGPINFGERDRFWGLMVEGFTEPTYLENYNPPYYQKLFEDYGFKTYFEQITYRVERDAFAGTRLEKIVQRLEQKPEYRLESFNFKYQEKLIKDFVRIYNAAWAHFENFKPVKEEDIGKIFAEIKPVIVPEFIWFAYYKDEPAAFIVMLPDVNQIFREMNGKFNFWSKLKFLYYLWTKKMDRIKGFVFGVAPEFRKLGLDAALMYKFSLEVKKTPQYKSAEIAWVGGFNPIMQSLMEGINARPFKKHITYRKLFDDNLEFKQYELK